MRLTSSRSRYSLRAMIKLVVPLRDDQPVMDQSLDEHLPFFVYGTLRNQCGNRSWCLRGRTTGFRDATLSGAVMWDNGGFPYVTMSDDPADTVMGEVHTPPRLSRMWMFCGRWMAWRGSGVLASTISITVSWRRFGRGMVWCWRGCTWLRTRTGGCRASPDPRRELAHPVTPGA